MANEMNPTECMGKKKGKSVRFNYDQKECRASRTLENYPLQLFGECKSSRCSYRRYELHCTVSTVACGPCQTENCDNPSNTQEVDTDVDDDTLN